MSVRIFVSLLIIFGIISSGAGLFIQDWQEKKSVPQFPCHSVIEGGQFIGNDLQPYIFDGILTWWPKRGLVSIFGIKKMGNDTQVVKQAVQLKDITQYGNAIYGHVDQFDIPTNGHVSLFPTLNKKGASVSFIFKPLSERKWLMMMNDNWVSMCEKK